MIKNTKFDQKLNFGKKYKVGSKNEILNLPNKAIFISPDSYLWDEFENIIHFSIKFTVRENYYENF